MNKLFVAKFRISRVEYEQLVQESRAQGHLTLANYVRSVVLDRGLRYIENKVTENNKILKELMQQLAKSKDRIIK